MRIRLALGAVVVAGAVCCSAGTASADDKYTEFGTRVLADGDPGNTCAPFSAPVHVQSTLVGLPDPNYTGG